MPDTKISFDIHAPLHGVNGGLSLQEKKPQRENVADNASALSLASAAANHVDRIQNNIGLTKPRYTDNLDGPINKAPLPILDRHVLNQIHNTVRNTYNLHSALDVMEKNKESAQNSVDFFAKHKLFGFIFSKMRNNCLRQVNAINKTIDKTDNLLLEIQTTCDKYALLAEAIDNLHAKRLDSIPADKGERAKFFENLRAREDQIKRFAIDIQQSVDGASRLVDSFTDSELGVAGVSRNLIKADHKLMINQLATSFNLLNQSIPRPKIIESMDDAIARTSELEYHLEAFEKEHGARALYDYLADGRITASVALQALRCGESLSPALKEAIADPWRIQIGGYIGHGSFNTVIDARLQDENGNWAEYALKPLDSRIETLTGLKEYGLQKRQVGVFGRQQAGATISDAMKLGVAGEPRYALINDRLYMAAPLIKGKSVWQAAKAIEATRNFGYWDVAKALHENPSFQNACQKVQLFQTLAQNYDGHANNLKIRFFEKQNGAEVEVKPERVAVMSSNRIRALRVEMGAFDLDLAFSANADIDIPVKADANGNIINIDAPGTVNYLGPPHWHTVQQYNDLKRFQADLQGKLGAALEDHLIGGDEQHPDRENLNELSALKLRVDKMVTVFDQQLQEGKRLNDRGNVVNKGGEVIQGGDHRERLSNEAGYVGYRRERNVCVKTSMAHMLMPVKGSKIPFNMLVTQQR